MERSLIGILGASGKVGQLVCDYLVRNTGYIVKAGYRKTIPFLFNGRLRWQFVDIQDVRSNTLHLGKKEQLEYGVLEVKVPCLLALRLVYTRYHKEENYVCINTWRFS